MKQGDIVNQKWKVEERVGKGTFCELFRAVDLESGDSVAVKVEAGGMQNSVLKWENEVVKALQDLPNVPRHLHFGRHDSNDVMVMELLAGEDMSALRRHTPLSKDTAGLQRKGGLPLGVCCHLALQMLECLKGMHSKGYLHRDVKPANFVRRVKGGKDFVIIDFGLAKQFRSPSGDMRAERDRAEFRGTSMYASLACHENKDQCRRDDLWSLLYVFFDLYLGKLPWAEQVKKKNKEAVAQLKRKYLEGKESFTDDMGVNISCALAESQLKALKWDEEPNYDALAAIFQDIRRGMSEEEKAEEKAFPWAQAYIQGDGELQAVSPPHPEAVASPGEEEEEEDPKRKEWQSNLLKIRGDTQPPPAAKPCTGQQEADESEPPGEKEKEKEREREKEENGEKHLQGEGEGEEGQGASDEPADMELDGEGDSDAADMEIDDEEEGEGGGGADPPATTPGGGGATSTSTSKVGQDGEGAAPAAQDFPLDARGRCQLWCSLAMSELPTKGAGKGRLRELRELMEAAEAKDTFFNVPGLKPKQVMKIQRIVFQVEEALAAALSAAAAPAPATATTTATTAAAAVDNAPETPSATPSTPLAATGAAGKGKAGTTPGGTPSLAPPPVISFAELDRIPSSSSVGSAKGAGAAGTRGGRGGGGGVRGGGGQGRGKGGGGGDEGSAASSGEEDLDALLEGGSDDDDGDRASKRARGRI